jgi:hypothetical protein
MRFPKTDILRANYADIQTIYSYANYELLLLRNKESTAFPVYVGNFSK